MLDTQSYKHTLKICNKYCFSTTTVVARTRLNTLNVKLNPICHLLALLEAHHILHVSRIRFNVTLSVHCLLILYLAIVHLYLLTYSMVKSPS